MKGAPEGAGGFFGIFIKKFVFEIARAPDWKPWFIFLPTNEPDSVILVQVHKKMLGLASYYSTRMGFFDDTFLTSNFKSLKLSAFSIRCNEGYCPPIFIYHNSLTSDTFVSIFNCVKTLIPTLTGLMMDCSVSQMEAARRCDLELYLCAFHLCSAQTKWVNQGYLIFELILV